MSHTTPRVPAQGAEAALVLRTGRADGCQAHFYPEQYQLVLRRDGFEEKVDLGFSGSRLLERLLRFPGEVVPRDELLAHAWSDRVVGQGSLNQQVYTLRQVLADEKKREIIQTLPRRGYMLNPKFLVNPEPATIAEVAADDLPPELAPLVEAPTPRQRHLMLLLGAGLAVLGLIVLAYIYYSLFQSEVLHQEADIGNKHFVYANPSQEGLQQLREDTQALVEQMAALTSQPASFRLGMSGSFYEMLCIQGDSVRWLMIHRAQIGHPPIEQLRSCLP